MMRLPDLQNMLWCKARDAASDYGSRVRIEGQEVVAPSSRAAAGICFISGSFYESAQVLEAKTIEPKERADSSDLKIKTSVCCIPPSAVGILLQEEKFAQNFHRIKI